MHRDFGLVGTLTWLDVRRVRLVRLWILVGRGFVVRTVAAAAAVGWWV